MSNVIDHLKITLHFLISMIQQNEFSARLIFSSIDLKNSCWKPLFQRRDIRVCEKNFYMIVI